MGWSRAAGTTDPVPGVVGNAAVFDGLDDVLTTDGLPTAMLAEGFTIACFGRDFGGDLDGNRLLVARTLGDGLYSSFGLGILSTGDEEIVGLLTELPASTTTILGAGQTFDDAWHHVALTWDGTEGVLYVDGNPVESAVHPQVDFDDHPLTVGAEINFDALANFFEGEIDEVQIFGRAFTPAEVQILADQGS